MISSKQVRNILEYSFEQDPNFTAPTATIFAAPDSYDTDNVPAAIVFSGNIVQNDGDNITWTITDALTSTTQAAGSGLSPALNMTTGIPTTSGVYTYYLNVFYEKPDSSNASFSVPVDIVVEVIGSYGQLDGPTANIVIPADLTPAIEATFTTTNQQGVINLFTVTAPFTGRIVFVIPDAWGTVTSIEDGGGLNVMDQFNAVVDAPNNRIIYVSINTVVAGTYDYKLLF